MCLLAVDIGSSACKAVAFAASGGILAQHACCYAADFPAPGFAEMDPEKFWIAVRACCRETSKDLKHPVQALALSSHGETFVPVDTKGRPLAHAILNQDSRALDEAAWCEEAIGREPLFQTTGLLSHAMYPIPKILWLRKNKPEIFAQTNCFVTLIGYFLQKMGLPPYADDSLASRFLAFDVRKRAWSDQILSAIELRKEQLPMTAPAGTIVGRLKAEAANELGLPAGTPVVLGGHDQPCGALGLGVISGGRVSDSMGTYECLVAASDAPSLNEKALAGSLNSYCHVVPGKFVTLAYFPSGIMVKWFHDLLYANGTETDHYELFEAHAPQGPTNLCITPHLIGTCNPEFNPRTRALIAGLNTGTGPGHIYKGILEGLACELSIVADTLADAVGPFDDIYVTGGGTRSALGLRLRAALTGRRLHVMRTQEAVCLGTAILAGVAVGEYASADQAVGALVKESAVVAPDLAERASYNDQCKRYKELRSVMVQ